MATGLKTRPMPDADRDNEDSWYNQQFAGMTDGAHYAKNGTPGELSQAEKNPEPTAKTDATPSPKEIANSEQQDGRRSMYHPDSTKSSGGGMGRRIKGLFKSRRTKRNAAAAGGGLIGLGLIIFTLFNLVLPFKIPSFMNGVDFGLPSGRMTRYMVEKPFRKMVIKYLIAKEMGSLDELAPKGSALSKLYGVFDAIDVKGIVKKQTGIEIVGETIGDIRTVRVVHEGRDMGLIDGRTQSLRDGTTMNEWTKFGKADRAFARASTDISRKALPVFRAGTVAGRVRLLLRAYGIRESLRPVVEAEGQTANQAVEERIKLQVAEGQIAAIESIPDVLSCASAPGTAECDGLNNRNQPKEVSDPSTRSGLASIAGAGAEEAAERAISEEIEQAVDKAVESGVKQGTEAATKTATKAILSTAISIVDVIGWVDIASMVDGLYTEIAKNPDLIIEAMAMPKEHMAMSIAASWSGYGDNIEAGRMSSGAVGALAPRLDGPPGVMENILVGRGGGVPLESRIINSKDALFAAGDAGHSWVAEALYGAPGTYAQLMTCQGKFAFMVVSPTCITHYILTWWRDSIGKGTAWINEKLADFVSFYFEHILLPAYDPIIKALWGDDWKTRLSQSIVGNVLRVFGVGAFDPTAIGTPLKNSIITGKDLINNSYLRSNLGAKEITNDPAAYTAYQELDAEYRDNIAAMPLKDRLFAADVPGSLVSQLAMRAPSKLNVATLPGTIASIVQSIPSSFASIFTGRSRAATTMQLIAAADGVGQYGGTLDELELDIPNEISDQKVTNIKDIQCPPNAKGYFNNCQRYKEVIAGAMCFDVKHPCPEYEQ